MKTTFCIWNGNVVFIWPCVLLFFRESLWHIELFSGIAHELIEFSRAKLTEIRTRQKSRNKRQYTNWCSNGWRLLPVHQLSLLCQLGVHHPCGARHSFSSRNPWRRRRSWVGTSDIFRCRLKASDCVGVESVGSGLFKPVSEIDVGGRSVGVGSRKKVSRPALHVSLLVPIVGVAT